MTHRRLTVGPWVILCACTILATGCGDKKKGEDADASDTVGDDVAPDVTGDTTLDTVPDIAPDTTEDTVVTDAPGDAPADETSDPGTDVVEDGEDAPLDLAADWPTDLPADWPTETSSECADAGGFCTEVRWELCPSGYEPIDPNPHRGCGESSGVQGWCCILAPPSPCSASSAANCIAGDSCTGCWSAVSLACEEGRVCCEDICD